MGRLRPQLWPEPLVIKLLGELSKADTPFIAWTKSRLLYFYKNVHGVQSGHMDHKNKKKSYFRLKLTFISRKKIAVGGVAKKPPGRNFDFRAKLRPGGFSLHRPIFALEASPNFGQAKHGQNGPTATDCQQCIFYPICGHHFTHRTHTNISFRFRPGGRRLKHFRFSRIFMSLW